MCWNVSPSLPGELAVARFQWACPVVPGGLCGPSSAGLCPAVGTGPGALCPGLPSCGLGMMHCLGPICLPAPRRGNGLFSPSCNCYHLFPFLVFVDVFLF